MIRPLPALAWSMGALPEGPLLLHALSLALHALAGFLIFAIVGYAAETSAAHGAGSARQSGRSKGTVLASLFAAFPLSSEPVVWLSASFDVWATVLALLSIFVAIQAEGRRGFEAAAGALFLLALLSKESVLCLPLVLALLLGWRSARRMVALTAAMALAYLAVRVLIFHGPGGYLDSTGRSIVWSVKPGLVLRSLFLRLPLRALVPFRGARDIPHAEVLAGALSALLLLLLAVSILGPARTVIAEGYAPHMRFSRLLCPWLAGMAALLPVLPIFSVDTDQEGSRFLYFPAAVLAIGCGLHLPALGPWSGRLAFALLVYWSGATLWNLEPWRAASWEVEHTLRAMRETAPLFPAHSQVFVAGHDTWRGAFALRNAIASAARLHGIRPDLRWFLGTVAGIDRPAEGLGKTLFEIGIDRDGHAVDWTPCAKELLLRSPALLGSFGIAWRGGPDPVIPALSSRRPLHAVQVRLGLGIGRPREPVAGWLFWRPAHGGRFNLTDAAPFFIGPRAAPEIVLRVPPELAPPSPPLAGISLWLHLPPEALGYVRTLTVATVPPVCEAPPVAHLAARPTLAAVPGVSVLAIEKVEPLWNPERTRTIRTALYQRQ
jgi:hypothetical protein